MRTKKRVAPPHLLVADDEGQFFDHPGLWMAGCSWDQAVLPGGSRATIIEPVGLQMVFLPGRRPIGFEPRSGRPVTLERFEAQGRSFTPHAVAAILPPGHLRHLLPAARTGAEAPVLPLRSYCAVGFGGGRLRVAASRIDRATHWDPPRFAAPDLEARIEALLKRFATNRVVRQLARCAREYFCCTARNVFLGTYEGAVPIAATCNARCLGCISEQAGPAVSPQQRLADPPELDEVVELAVFHLQRAQPAMISFGQGCEGEPLTRADFLAQAIAQIRKTTDRGAVHLNTNGSRPEALESLAAAGLQSVRVSLASARPEAFAAYHRGDFGLTEVERFITRAVQLGLFVSLNLLTYPGFTDRPGELEAVVGLLVRSGAQMVQLRNLDLDPDRFQASLQPAAGKPLGLEAYVRALRAARPGLQIGSFNRFREDWAIGRDGH